MFLWYVVLVTLIIWYPTRYLKEPVDEASLPRKERQRRQKPLIDMSRLHKRSLIASSFVLLALAYFLHSYIVTAAAFYLLIWVFKATVSIVQLEKTVRFIWNSICVLFLIDFFLMFVASNL